MEAELRAKLDARPPAARLPRRRSDRDRAARRPLRAAAEAAQVPGAGPSGDLPDRRLHRDDRRSERAGERAPPLHARGGAGPGADLHRAGLPRARRGEDRGALQRRVARRALLRRPDRAGEHLPDEADHRAARLPAAHGPRRVAALPRGALRAHAGLRRLRAQVRRAGRRLRPALQHARRPRDPGALRRPAARHDHQPDHHRHRRAQDVEVLRQHDQRQRHARGHVRQGDADRRRAHPRVPGADQLAARRRRSTRSWRS